MAKVYGLSEDDLKILRGVIDRERRKPMNTVGRPHIPTDPDDHLAPEVYLAFIERDIPGREDTKVNYVSCNIYRLLSDGRERSLIALPNFVKDIYNVSSTLVAGGEYRIVRRDKFGDWVIESISQEEITGTGVSCQDITFTTFDFKCEEGTSTGTGDETGLLNKYKITHTISVDSDGCLAHSESDEEFVETVSCCDPDCPVDQLTGTGTGTPGNRTTGTGTDQFGTGSIGTGTHLVDCAAITCTTCLGITPGYWTTIVEGFTDRCSVWNGPWVARQLTNCTWGQTGSEGERIEITFPTSNTIRATFYAVVGGITAIYAVYEAGFSGNCCIPATLLPIYSSCTGYPASIVITPCCESSVGTGINNTCCVRVLPTTLYATFAGALAPLGTVTLTYNAGLGYWVGNSIACGGRGVNFFCTPSTNTYGLSVSSADPFTGFVAYCDVPYFQWNGNSLNSNAPCPGASSVVVFEVP